jgi:hypothetical protein
MNELATALGPAFAAGFAVQRILEMLDSIGFSNLGDRKKLVFSLVSLAVGLTLAFAGGIRVLRYLSQAPVAPDWVDACVTGLIVSGGTEGFNSIMKFLSYKKEEKKGDAVAKTSSQNANAMAAMSSK